MHILSSSRSPQHQRQAQYGEWEKRGRAAHHHQVVYKYQKGGAVAGHQQGQAAAGECKCWGSRVTLLPFNCAHCADFTASSVFHYLSTFICPFNLCFSFVVLLCFYMCPLFVYGVWSVLQSPTSHPKNTCTQKKKKKQKNNKTLTDSVCLGYAKKWQHTVECYS